MLWSKSVKCPSAPSSLHCSALDSTAQKKLHCSAVHCRKLHCRKMQPGRAVKIVKIGLVGASSCPSVPSLSSLTWGTCGLSYSPVSRASLKLNHNIRIVCANPYLNSYFCANFINQNSFCDIRENTPKSYGKYFH